MKKFLNIIITVLICISIFFIFDYIQYKIIVKKTNEQPAYSYLHQLFSPNYYSCMSSILHNKPFEYKLKYYRKNIYNRRNNAKNPILVFGCSFAFGYLLDDENTFSNKLSKKTKRNVHNMSMCACGIQHMFRLLKDKIFYEYINKNEISTPEYAIYIYIPSHLQRISSYTFPSIIGTDGANLLYGIKNSKLVQKKPIPFFHKCYTVKKLLSIIDNKNNPKLLEMKYKNFAIANELFTESKNLLKSHYPNIKFVILRYNYDLADNEYELPYMWDILKKEGFIIIDSKDLIGRIYTKKDTVGDNFHPSEKTWDELVPKLIEELKL